MSSLTMASNETENLLEQNCRPDWPEWTCMFANICGLASTTLWFLVLLPQVWKNFRRKSVRGLSVLWATANFTASLTNLFFVQLYAKVPLYNRINSIYMPILEFTILVQFWIYGDHYNLTNRQVYLAACLLLWAAIIIMQLVLKWYDHLQWFAISLWCIETFPQVILNMKLQSTKGQSTVSVLIAMIGKTTDFLSNNILIVPLQFVVMIYFSSSVAYVNGIQVFMELCCNADQSTDSRAPLTIKTAGLNNKTLTSLS
ncbi:hypothetical protein CHS0354_010149 [Potamilus streckersoni]|uniref:Uncharacterized protein n=1 Tax=Potamilus streckersoni TaxID=2493646 RepID=A0AAE0S382_9BIVA|nr:hypothetical protein CHS0354_010149 [Potamilus streckersoni]